MVEPTKTGRITLTVEVLSGDDLRTVTEVVHLVLPVPFPLPVDVRRAWMETAGQILILLEHAEPPDGSTTVTDD